jgi:nitroreductase
MFDAALARQQPGDPPPFPKLKKMIESFERIPAMIICCVELRPGQPAGAGDYGSIFPAVQNLLLAARGIDLGAALTSGWAMQDMAELRAVFGIPDGVEPVAFVPVGHPDGERYGPTTRRPVDEVLHWDGWEAGKPNSAVLPYR